MVAGVRGTNAQRHVSSKFLSDHTFTVTFNPRSPEMPGTQVRLRECKENCNDENETKVYDARTCGTESPCYALPMPHCDEWSEWGTCRGTTSKCSNPRRTRTQSCVGRLIVTPTLVRWVGLSASANKSSVNQSNAIWGIVSKMLQWMLLSLITGKRTAKN